MTSPIVSRATLITREVPNAAGDAALYRLDPPVTLPELTSSNTVTAEYVVVSAVTPPPAVMALSALFGMSFHPEETIITASDERMSYFTRDDEDVRPIFKGHGYLDHARALREIGVEVDPDQEPLDDRLFAIIAESIASEIETSAPFDADETLIVLDEAGYAALGIGAKVTDARGNGGAIFTKYANGWHSPGCDGTTHEGISDARLASYGVPDRVLELGELVTV